MQNKPIKILIDARSLGKRPSGIGMYVYNIVQELKRDPDFQIELATDICESSEMKALRDSGIPIRIFGKEVTKSFSLFSYYRYLQKCIYDVKPDLFWEVNHLVPINIKNPYGKLLTTVHDMFAITQPQHYGRKYPVYFRYGMKKTVKNFDIFLYNSEETRKETERLFPVVKNKKNYVGYFIIPEMPEEPVTDNRSFLYIGNLETRKGTDILLSAFEKYREAGGAYELRLAGNIRNSEIEKKLGQMTNHLNSGVSYLGYLNSETKAKEYASCSCFVFPSRSEGFGVPIVEAMYYEKPVLASNLPIFHEIAGDSIQYVDLTGDAENQGTQLSEALLKEEKKRTEIPKGHYNKIMKRYSEYTLGLKYGEILKECAK